MKEPIHQPAQEPRQQPSMGSMEMPSRNSIAHRPARGHATSFERSTDAASKSVQVRSTEKEEEVQARREEAWAKSNRRPHRGRCDLRRIADMQMHKWMDAVDDLSVAHTLPRRWTDGAYSIMYDGDDDVMRAEEELAEAVVGAYGSEPEVDEGKQARSMSKMGLSSRDESEEQKRQRMYGEWIEDSIAPATHSHTSTAPGPSDYAYAKHDLEAMRQALRQIESTKLRLGLTSVPPTLSTAVPRRPPSPDPDPNMADSDKVPYMLDKLHAMLHQQISRTEAESRGGTLPDRTRPALLSWDDIDRLIQDSTKDKAKEVPVNPFAGLHWAATAGTRRTHDRAFADSLWLAVSHTDADGGNLTQACLLDSYMTLLNAGKTTEDRSTGQKRLESRLDALAEARFVCMENLDDLQWESYREEMSGWTRPWGRGAEEEDGTGKGDAQSTAQRRQSCDTPSEQDRQVEHERPKSQDGSTRKPPAKGRQELERTLATFTREYEATESALMALTEDAGSSGMRAASLWQESQR